MESIVKVAGGEYSVYYLTDLGNLYTYAWNQTLGKTVPTLVLNKPVKDMSGGMHNGLCVDTSGNVWTYGENLNGEQGSNSLGGNGLPYQILKDFSGNPFTGIHSVAGWFSTNYALKDDGTVWIWGQDVLNLFGGNVLAPRQLPTTGTIITKIVSQVPFLALDALGNVWEWKSGSRSPTQVTLPGKATDIAGCAAGVSFAVVDGSLYGWGTPYGPGNWGFNNTVTPLQKLWNVQAPIVSIVGNDNTLHYIDVNGKLWGVGDNAMGEIGNGDEINYSVVTPPNGLYAWNWLKFQRMVKIPAWILPGVSFKQICAQSSYMFYVYAQDIKGNWYSWGRNKGAVLGNGVSLQDALASTYPNLVDQPTPTIVNPLIVNLVPVTSLAMGAAIYTANTGYGKTTTTTTTSSTTKATTSTTSTTTSTTSSTTTTTTTKHWSFITLFNDGLWEYTL